ncbi:protein kinase [Seminavis robusta]|uniref:Protein kinase n=1 Tax=Seminavis robusta TaxID=568900 RepID=A0A9N8HXL5_9STRA|nr:protein kinase [Seminavis robusta]|eukprot:Sro2539_g330560.1 protein kinase (638) ;mRNA; f:504-2417
MTSYAVEPSWTTRTPVRQRWSPRKSTPSPVKKRWNSPTKPTPPTPTSLRFHDDDQQYSPRHHHRANTRSWSQEARLWLLKSRQCILMWKRLLVIVGTLSVSTVTLMRQQQDFHGQQESLRYMQHRSLVESHRELYRELEWQMPSRNVITAFLAQPPVFNSKPKMVGLLWPSTHHWNDYYYKNNKNSKQKQEDPAEELLSFSSSVVVTIDPKDFTIVKGIDKSRLPRPGDPPTNWAKVVHAMPRRSVTLEINYTTPEELSEEDEEDAEEEAMDWPIPEGCEMQYKWQSESFPTCNNIHEQDIRGQLRVSTEHSHHELHISHHHGHSHHRHLEESNMQARLLAAGGYRNVWMIHNHTDLGGGVQENPIALKTLLFEREWQEKYFKVHNLDALVSDRLQSSPFIMDLYAYCGTSGLYEFASEGNLLQYTEKNFEFFTSQTKLELAYNVARAISDLHNMAEEGKPVVAHTDIFPNQFVRDDPSMPFKLNDFNRARWIHLPKKEPWVDASHAFNASAVAKDKEACGFTFGANRGNFRSPEEYTYRLETEAIDVFSMGNILYFLLTGDFPFDGAERETVRHYLKHGRRQHIPDEYKTSEDPLIQAIVKSIRISWIHEPSQRATARQVEKILRRTMIENDLWQE